MDLKTVRPIHGWRAFIGEVGVVVVGVLLALGAQEIAQDIQARTDQRAFRETIDHEIGLNLFFYDVRASQFACDSKRIADLRNWLDQARSGAEVPAILPRAPQTITPYRSAWDTRDAQVFNHLPADVRQKYAEFYDELGNNWSIVQVEDDNWKRLVSYAETGPISLSDRRVIRPVIAQIRDANDILRANLPISRKIAEVLKVKAIQPDNMPADWLNQIADCPSVIAIPHK